MKFKDLKIGDIFAFGRYHFVKIGNIPPNTDIRFISECYPTAVNLSNEHYIACAPNMPVKIVKQRKDPKFTEPAEIHHIEKYMTFNDNKKEWLRKLKIYSPKDYADYKLRQGRFSVTGR